MASQFSTRRETEAPPPAISFTFNWWKIVLALLVILLLSHTASWYGLQAMNDRLERPLVSPIGPVALVVSGVVLSVLKFIVLALAIVGAVKLLGGAGSARSIVTAFLLIPAANLIASLLSLAGFRFAAFATNARLTHDTPLLDTVSGAITWLILTPHPMTAILLALAVVAARVGGRLDWIRAGIAGLAVASVSLALGYLFFVMVSAPETALRIALGQILRLG